MARLRAFAMRGPAEASAGGSRCGGGLPLDVAAHAGSLGSGHWLASQNRLESGTEACAGNGTAILGAAIVKLTPIDEFAVTIEQEEIRRAARLISPGYFLRSIVKIGECVAGLLDFHQHFFRAVVWIVFRIIGIDGHDGGAALLELARDFGKARLNVLHVRAMVADKRDQQSRRAREIVG